jgi:hypothetical protein
VPIQAPADGRLTCRPADLPQLDAQLALLTGARVHSTWALAAIVVLAAACGGGSEGPAVARPQVVRVGTTEIDGYSGVGSGSRSAVS